MKLLSLLLLSIASGVAQPSLDLPRLGCLRDAQNQLRFVYGIRGSFVLSRPVATEVSAYYCSEKLIAAQTPKALIAFDQSGLELASIEVAADVTLQFDSDGKVLLSNGVYVFDGKHWTDQEGGSPDPRRTPTSGPKLTTCTARLEDSKVTLCEDTLPGLPPVVAVEQIGPDWLHIRTSEGSYAVTLRDRKPETYLLPANPPIPEERP